MLSFKHGRLTRAIIGAAFEVHRVLGHGFLEKVYQRAMQVELQRQGLEVELEVPIQVAYKGTAVGNYIADLLVERRVLVELKVARQYNPKDEPQLLNELKATGIEVGLLINFGAGKVEFKRLAFSELSGFEPEPLVDGQPMTLERNDIQQAFEELRGLGSVGQMRELAGRGCVAARQKVNSHVHLPPNFSAFRDVRQVVELADAQGVRVLGASNYYDYAVYGEFGQLAREQGIFPLFGLEVICWDDELAKAGVKINDPGNPGKFYLCGKGITRFGTMTAEAQRLIGVIRRNDSARMARIVARVSEVFEQGGVKTGLDEAAVVEMVVRRHGCARESVYLQERHVCQAFQERFFEVVPAARRVETLARVFGTAPKAGAEAAVKVQNEIRAQMLKAGKSAYVEETFVGFEEAYRLVEELGGIPCYPTLADGANPVCAFERPVEELIERIRQRGIGCAEFIPVRNAPAVLSTYVKAMRAAGLVVTAGTEHNTLDLLPIEPTCLNGQAIDEDVKNVFWEGACVVAAHQFLGLHGERGFEAGCGEGRIRELAGLGAAVIYRYQEGSGKRLTK